MKYQVWVQDEDTGVYEFVEDATEEQFRKVYGPLIDVHSFPEDEEGWRIYQLTDNIGGSSGCDLYFQREDGSPAIGMQVAQYWPDAQERDGGAPANGLPDGVTERYDIGNTDIEGRCGWSWGGGSYYTPWPDENTPHPEKGPHAYWPLDIGSVNADVIHGVGMIRGSNHRHPDVYYKWFPAGDGPPPGPGPGPGPSPDPDPDVLDEINEKMDQCLRLQRQIISMLQSPPPP